MKWNELRSPDQLDVIREESKSKTVLIFKHSSRCSVSQLTLDRLQRKWGVQADGIKPYFLDLISFRELSNRVADQFSVEHESPQVLLIRNGDAIYDRSHFDIEFSEILTAASN
ncbi:MAG TPA: bacillithiol system redox-active protein YtxJ [Chryseolinea sp.]|nr:bacillithiol system redox-active protein YtxJ [Chryseolinea sp.]